MDESPNHCAPLTDRPPRATHRIIYSIYAEFTPAGKWAGLIVGGLGGVACALHLWTDAAWVGVEPMAVA